MSDERPVDLWNRSLGEELRFLSEMERLRVLSRQSGVDFSSNDYLSLNEDGIIDTIVRDVAAGGRLCGSTGSRLIRGHDERFETAEERFARYAGHETALLFGSGYAANTGAIPALISREDTVLADRLCHASLIDGIRLSGAKRHSFEHNDINDLESKLRARANGSSSRVWIVTESLFSMDGDSPDLASLVDLAERHGALVYLDCAHSLGLNGENGGGEVRELDLNDRIAVGVYPMGKAPGFAGAFVCGSTNLREILINRARSFLFSTAQPPFFAEVLNRIIAYLVSEEAAIRRERVFANTMRLRLGLKRIGIDAGGTSQIVPVILGGDGRTKDVQEFLIDRGYDVRGIRPPSVPENTCRLRVCIHASRTEGEIDGLIGALDEIL